MDIDDARRMNQQFSSVVPNYTDILFAIPPGSTKLTDADNVGSAVHLEHESNMLAITCNHVATPGCNYFTNGRRLPTPQIPVDIDAMVPPVDVVSRSNPHDLAVLDTSELPLTKHGKNRYDLKKSSVVRYESLKGKEGLAAYIYGTWAKHTPVHDYEDGVSYSEIVVFSSIGPIIDISKDVITVDITEKDVLAVNQSANIPDEDKIPSGGSRDISGCSGCGLWIMCKEPILAGTLVGPIVATSTKHTTRCTPIWRTIELITNIH